MIQHVASRTLANVNNSIALVLIIEGRTNQRPPRRLASLRTLRYLGNCGTATSVDVWLKLLVDDADPSLGLPQSALSATLAAIPGGC